MVQRFQLLGQVTDPSFMVLDKPRRRYQAFTQANDVAFKVRRFLFGAVLAKRDAWARIAGCMREEAGSVVGSVIV